MTSHLITFLRLVTCISDCSDLLLKSERSSNTIVTSKEKQIIIAKQIQLTRLLTHKVREISKYDFLADRIEVNVIRTGLFFSRHLIDVNVMKTRLSCRNNKCVQAFLANLIR